MSGKKIAEKRDKLPRLLSSIIIIGKQQQHEKYTVYTAALEISLKLRFCLLSFQAIPPHLEGTVLCTKFSILAENNFKLSTTADSLLLLCSADITVVPTHVSANCESQNWFSRCRADLPGLGFCLICYSGEETCASSLFCRSTFCCLLVILAITSNTRQSFLIWALPSLRLCRTLTSLHGLAQL